MLKFKIADTQDELDQILNLQEENHRNILSDTSQRKDGFVSVLHTPAMLKQMNELAPQIIAKDHNRVIAYALVMSTELAHLVPMLQPMFESFHHIGYKGTVLSNLSLYVMGQICVQQDYRRQGISQQLYLTHKEILSDRYDYCVTEVSSSNVASNRAHKKIGFQIIHTYSDDTDEWNMILWDWNT